MATITLNTTRFGEISVEEELVLTFVSPILGFEQFPRYILLDHDQESPFHWLQSVENPNLAFVVTNPKYFGIDYEFVLPEDAVQRIAATAAEDIVVFTIVNIPDDNPNQMTANLLAPVVINQKNRSAMQIVLQDSTYSTRERLLNETPEPVQSGSSKTTSGE